jgi:hypothetical protein
METFAYVCIRQISLSSQSDQRLHSDHIILRYIQSLDSGNIVALCRLFLSIAGTIIYYYSPVIVRSVPIHRLALISLFHCGICCILYGTSSPYSILYAILSEGIRGGMYALLWSACTNHVQSTKFTNSLFGVGNASAKHGHTSTLQTILEAVYKGFGHSLGGICGGKFVKYVGSLPHSFLVVGKGVLMLSFGLGLFNEVFSYACTTNIFQNSSLTKPKDKIL